MFVLDLTLIELSQTAMDNGTHNVTAAAKDNNNIPNGILYYSEQQSLINHGTSSMQFHNNQSGKMFIATDLLFLDAAAAIANTLPEMIKNVEQEEMNRSAIGKSTLKLLLLLSYKWTTCGLNYHLLILETLRNYNNLPTRVTNANNNLPTQMTNANKNVTNKEFPVTNFNALSNHTSLEIQNGNKNQDVIGPNEETTAPDFNTSQMSKFILILF